MRKKRKIIIWDNDGTIQGSKDPNDKSHAAKVILPNVERIMSSVEVFNVICSGCKTPESEKQNFNPQEIIIKFKRLMERLPIKIVAFSPAIGGVECYVLIKRKSNIVPEIRKAHEDPRYHCLIGKFKKPDIGMLIVIKDLLKEEFNIHAQDPTTLLMIGDTWHDKEAAQRAGFSFLNAAQVHELNKKSTLEGLYSKKYSLKDLCIIER